MFRPHCEAAIDQQLHIKSWQGVPSLYLLLYAAEKYSSYARANVALTRGGAKGVVVQDIVHRLVETSFIVEPRDSNP
jgi:hypothetical protein